MRITALALMGCVLLAGCGKQENFEQPAPDADEAPAFDPAAEGAAEEGDGGFSLRIPGVEVDVKGGQVDVRTPVGELNVDDQQGRVDIDSPVGKLNVDGTSGRVDLKTPVVDVEVDEEGARVEALTTESDEADQ